MARFAITMDELKETLGYAILPYLQKLAEYGIQIANAFGKGGVAGAFAELKYILKTLIYDENGQLNQAGKTINDVIGKLNAIAGFTNKGVTVFDYASGNALFNAIGQLTGGAGGFDLPRAPTLNTLPNFALTQRNPENAQIQINVYGVVGDKAAVGQAVTQSIRAWERRTSGGR